MSFEESYYENQEQWVRGRFRYADLQRYATLADKLPLDVRSLLDVGCGNGLFLQHLGGLHVRKFERLCGVDRSKEALTTVQVENVRASVESLPFKNSEFDAVSCLEVLEHLSQTTFTDALDELSRTARRYILVSVPYNEDLRMSLTECSKCCCRFHPYYHLRTFNTQTVQALFDSKGFTCSEVFHMCPERVVPWRFESVLRLFGMVRRKILRQPLVSIGAFALCPACGYSPCNDGSNSWRSVVQPVRTSGMTRAIRSVLSVRASWRWFGALYVRM